MFSSAKRVSSIEQHFAGIIARNEKAIVASLRSLEESVKDLSHLFGVVVWGLKSELKSRLDKSLGLVQDIIESRDGTLIDVVVPSTGNTWLTWLRHTVD